MRTLMSVCVALPLLMLALEDRQANAQGRGGQRGGSQQAARGMGNQGGSGAQSGMMMQRGNRWGQSGRGGGPGPGPGYGSGNGGMQQQCPGYGLGAGSMGKGQQAQQRGNRGGGQAFMAPSGGTAASSAPLSQREAEFLLQVREEEKLARDVYLALGKKWNVPAFANIVPSESRHMEVVKGLLARYGLQDPVTDDTPGVFANTKFADLYRNLVETGSASAADAYRVGVQIEELDIADLKEGLATTTHSDIRMVYQNLMRASQNHLRAFSRYGAAKQ
ncbi:MAG: DUF2202 domain-containing protein [Thermoguttaceae bacterium]